MIYKYFLPLRLPFHFVTLCLLMVSFAVQRLFSLMLHFFIFAFVAFAFGVKSKKSLSRLMLSSLQPIFSFRNLMVSGVMFKSLMNFELIFVYGIR